MKNVFGKEIPENKNPYRKNDTMRLLGQQCAASIIGDNDVVRHEIKEISEARPYTFTVDAAIDIFMLGYIYGKRAERARRKKTT